MNKKNYQLIEKEVTKASELVRISEDLDRDYKKLTGIAVLWTMGKHHNLSSSSLSGKDLLPKNFELAFLQSNTYVPVNDRFFELDEVANGNKIELEIKDGGYGKKYPYTMKIYLRLEN
jgi:hypothetical protein